MKQYLMILIIGLVVSAGCISQQEPEKYTYVIKKHGIEYIFSNPIENASLIPVINETEILNEILTTTKVRMTFESHEVDNIAFQLAGVDTSSKLSHFYVYGQGRFVDMGAEELINLTEDDKANATIIQLKGPNTGATDTSVYLDQNGWIIIQGTHQKNLTLAADRFALIYLRD